MKGEKFNVQKTEHYYLLIAIKVIWYAGNRLVGVNLTSSL